VDKSNSKDDLKFLSNESEFSWRWTRKAQVELDFLWFPCTLLPQNSIFDRKLISKFHKMTPKQLFLAPSIVLREISRKKIILVLRSKLRKWFCTSTYWSWDQSCGKPRTRSKHVATKCDHKLPRHSKIYCTVLYIINFCLERSAHSTAHGWLVGLRHATRLDRNTQRANRWGPRPSIANTVCKITMIILLPLIGLLPLTEP